MALARHGALSAPLWPGRWAKNNAAWRLIKRDLDAAREAWIGEEKSANDRDARQESDFLAYRDADGRTTDFHSLRHRFVTELVKAGVQPKDAKELARHSSITLTMDRYAHVGIRDTAAAVGKLTLPQTGRPGLDSTALRATGDRAQRGRVCTAGCTSGRKRARTCEDR